MTKALLFILFALSLFSCTKNEITDIVLTTSKDEILASGQDAVSFTVSDADGNDITSKVQIFKDDEPYSNTKFSTDLMGEYYFRAEYEDLVSNTKKINALALVKHQKNLLIEDYTGTWCGYCPRVATAIKSVLTHKTNIDVVAIHDDNEMGFSQVELLKKQFEIDGFPTAIIERTYKWPYPEEENGLNAGFKRPANCGLQIETSVKNKQAAIKVDVEFAGGYNKPSKLVVYITENNLKYSQANYYPEFGSNPISGFVHNHVLRKSLTHVLGDEIKEDFTGIISRTFYTDLQKYTIENITVVAFVVDKSDNKTLNSRSVELGADATFQYLN